MEVPVVYVTTSLWLLFTQNQCGICPDRPLNEAISTGIVSFIHKVYDKELPPKQSKDIPGMSHCPTADDELDVDVASPQSANQDKPLELHDQVWFKNFITVILWVSVLFIVQYKRLRKLLLVPLHIYLPVYDSSYLTI